MSAVSLAPEVIFRIGNIPISNTILSTLLVDAVLVSFVFLVRQRLAQVPGFLQTIAESAVGYFYSTTEQIAGKFTNVIYPWFASFFLFIFSVNIIGLFPGFGTIGFFRHEHGEEVFVPLLRAATS